MQPKYVVFAVLCPNLWTIRSLHMSQIRLLFGKTTGSS